MAEEQENKSRDDLSDEPSPFRLEEFRRKGQVAQSRELAGLTATIAAGMALIAVSPGFGTQIVEFVKDVFNAEITRKIDLGNLQVLGLHLGKVLNLIGVIALPVALAAAATSFLTSAAQIGAVFSVEPLTPDLSRVNPLSGLQRFLSKKHLFDSIRMLLKFACLSVASYFVIRSEILIAPLSQWLDTGQILIRFSESGKSIFFPLIGILLVFGLADLLLERWQYFQRARVTKEEAKQEQKEKEGDPLIKARIRSIQREVARRRMMNAVKKADVVIMNPTHFAVALLYEREKMTAPKLIAKGQDLIALQIKTVALESNVPVVENPPLARSLFKAVKIGQYIPSALYQAVAEVLAAIYKIRKGLR